MPKNRSYFLLCLALVCVGVAATGCGAGGATPVTGTVKYEDGTPLTKGTVYFDGSLSGAAGEIKPNGKYTMGSTGVEDGVKPGTYRVYLGGDAAGGGYDGGEQLVASKFLSPSESGLSVEVGNSATTYDITVEKSEGAAQ